MADTPTSLVARMPEDYVDLIGRFIGDSDIDIDDIEVKEYGTKCCEGNEIEVFYIRFNEVCSCG